MQDLGIKTINVYNMADLLLDNYEYLYCTKCKISLIQIKSIPTHYINRKRLFQISNKSLQYNRQHGPCNSE